MGDGFYFDPADRAIDWGAGDSLILVNPEWRRREPESFDAARRRLPTLDGHVWISTSGASRDRPGRIRWVALSKAALLASAAAVNAHLGATAVDVWAHALPMFHVGGVGILARARLAGSRVVPAIAARWDARHFHLQAGDTRATLSALVPSQIHDLVEAGLAAPPSMRAIVVGGARLDADLYRRARALGWPCLPSYGLTETCSQVATASLATLSSTEVPTVLPVLGHAEMRANEAQRLSIRGTSLLTCYAELDGDDVRAWDPKQDAWLETEDLGRVDALGVEVFGRTSESVKVLGEVVSLPRVEEHARRWAAGEALFAGMALDLAVVALPHPRAGHELVLVLSSDGRDRLEPLTTGRLWPSFDQFEQEALLPFERIQRVVWVDRIPRTPLGKCRRALLAREVGLQAGPDL
ncbi:MAG TPA: AMP-binding protein [Vicinamibacterales bacterium]|jgi:O-succinylbenzoic acid--CoA ligase